MRGKIQKGEDENLRDMTPREEELRGTILPSERAWADWFDGIPNADTDRAVTALVTCGVSLETVPYHLFAAAMGCVAPDPVRIGIWWGNDPPTGRFLDLPGGGAVRLGVSA